MIYLALFLIFSACAVAFYNWRWGFFAAILVGLVQDPLRKMTPGTPGLLAMATVPVWISVIAGAWRSGAIRVGPFLRQFPKMGRSMRYFGAYLLLPAAISAGYGRNTWQITVLGAVMYAAIFFVFYCGWRFPIDYRAPVRMLGFYAVVASLMLIGGPLQYLGWNARYAAIGTEALDHVWITHRVGAGGLIMIAGFFRGPDVMGWHASLVFMIGVILAVRTRGPMRFFWIALAVWGGLSLWLCGRRKMVSMIPVFLGCYLFLIFKFKDVQRWVLAASILLVTLGAGWYAISSYLHTDAAEIYYMSALYEADDQLRRHAVASVWTTIRQAGFWGYGLGMGQQGIHHIDADKPRLWQESGPPKLVAELGVPGAILFVILLFNLAMTAYHVIRHSARGDGLYFCAGIYSVLAANISAGLVSAQIFGDPFVMTLLASMSGLLLAEVRIGEK